MDNTEKNSKTYIRGVLHAGKMSPVHAEFSRRLANLPFPVVVVVVICKSITDILHRKFRESVLSCQMTG